VIEVTLNASAPVPVMVAETPTVAGNTSEAEFAFAAPPPEVSGEMIEPGLKSKSVPSFDL
jgi:hypothetical protein